MTEARWESEDWSYKTLYRGHGVSGAERVFYWSVYRRSESRPLFVTVTVVVWPDGTCSANLHGEPNFGVPTVTGRRRFATTTDALGAVVRYLNDKHGAEA